MDVTRDSTLVNANDCACVIVFQYQSAWLFNVVVTHAYSYQFQLPAGSSTGNKSKIYTPYVPVKFKLDGGIDVVFV